jgi:MoxR-like ATPase
MQVQNSYRYITLAHATDLVASIGDKVTTLITGPMGCGKSSILKSLASRFPTHRAIYLEAQTLDLGDLQMPKFKTVEGQDVVAFAPNEALGFHLEQPVILMFDEIGKASKAVLNAVLRIMLERKLGDRALPEGSIVFATTNRGTEGLGDNVPAHMKNRICQVNVTKPTAMSWVEDWALRNRVHPVVIGAAMEYPSMFEDDVYVEDPNSNHYIFHPKQPRTAFVTPRSLEKASDILKATEELPDDVRTHALMGVVGEAAAMDILTLVKLDEQLPSYERIVNDPEDCKLPKPGAAACMVVAKIAMRVTREEMDNILIYVQRLPAEVQALWMRTMMSGEKKGMAATHGGFTKLAAAKIFLFS